jgi:flagellar basal-body rod modification protein FlgD
MTGISSILPTTPTTPSATTGTAAASDASTALSSLSQNADNFLKLLTTQLQNQDPMSPMDSTQFTQQLVQFSAVEQSIVTNKNLENLISLQNSSMIAQATSYMGHTIESNGSNQQLKNGTATFGYHLASESNATSIAITNSSGQVVFHGTGETGAGDHSFTWNGQDDNGVQQPDGNYTITVGAVDGQNNPITTTTQVSGQVTGIEVDSGQPVLMIGTTKVNMSDVTAIIG